LTDTDLTSASKLAQAGHNRSIYRDLTRLSGEWHAERREWREAKTALTEAVAMARAAGVPDGEAEPLLALARLHLGEVHDASADGANLAQPKGASQRYLGQFWLDAGDVEQARRCAVEAYKRAWGDGEPYVFRYGLQKAQELLEALREPIPQLPAYDASKQQKFPCEDEFYEYLEQFRAEKAGSTNDDIAHHLQGNF
jgi:hypothetical protein